MLFWGLLHVPTLCLQSEDTTSVTNPTYLSPVAVSNTYDEPLAGGNTYEEVADGGGGDSAALYSLATRTDDDDNEPEPMYTLASGNEGNPAVAELAGCKIVSGRPSRRKGAETAAERAQRLRLARDQMLTLPTRGEGVYTIDKKLRSSTDTTFGADVPDLLPFSPCLQP